MRDTAASSGDLSDYTLAAQLGQGRSRSMRDTRPPARPRRRPPSTVARQAIRNLSDCTLARWTFTLGPQERRKPPGWRRALATGPKARSRASQGLRRAICTERKPGDPLPWRKTSRPSCVTGVPSWPPAVALRPARATPWQAHKLLSGQGPLFVSSSAHRALTNQGGDGEAAQRPGGIEKGGLPPSAAARAKSAKFRSIFERPLSTVR